MKVATKQQFLPQMMIFLSVLINALYFGRSKNPENVAMREAAVQAFCRAI